MQKQKCEFLDLKLQESKQQMELQKSNHEQLIKAIQNKEHEQSMGKEEASRRLHEMQQQNSKEITDLTHKYEDQLQKLQIHADQLSERNGELELSLKIQISDFEKEVSQLKEQLAQTDDERSKAMETNKNLDAQKLKLLEETEARHKEAIRDLEREREEREERTQ